MTDGVMGKWRQSVEQRLRYLEHERNWMYKAIVGDDPQRGPNRYGASWLTVSATRALAQKQAQQIKDLIAENATLQWELDKAREKFDE